MQDSGETELLGNPNSSLSFALSVSLISSFSFFSFFALTRVGSSALPLEVLNPSLKLQATQSIHQKRDPSPVRDRMLWTNELSAWYVCHISVHKGGNLYLLQHIKQACIIFQYKEKSPPLSGVLVLVLDVKLFQ